MPAVRQVVFADVQITSRQRVAVLPVLEDVGRRFYPIGLHKTVLLVAHKMTLTGLPGVQVQS